jgi:hypothetical protein
VVDIVDPSIARFYQYWMAKRGNRRYPSRAALDPVDFRYVLGDIVLVDAALDHGSAASMSNWVFRYRLMGTNIVTVDGYDLTNKTLEDLPEPEYRERIRKTWTQVCRTGEPAHYIRDVILDGRLRRYEVLALPLAADGETIDTLVTVQRQRPNRPFQLQA